MATHIGDVSPGRLPEEHAHPFGAPHKSKFRGKAGLLRAFTLIIAAIRP
jgi:hypothetical protein